MSQEQAWTLEEMARAIHAERLASAERQRLAMAAAGPSASPRIVLAHALRSLASLLDGEPEVTAQPGGRLVRAY